MKLKIKIASLDSVVCSRINSKHSLGIISKALSHLIHIAYDVAIDIFAGEINWFGLVLVAPAPAPRVPSLRRQRYLKASYFHLCKEIHQFERVLS